MNVRIVTTLVLLFGAITLNAQSQVYELRTYEIGFFGQADLLHNYFEKALIPALNRQGVGNIGAFEESGEVLPKKIYLLIAHDNLQSIENTLESLASDSQYQTDGEPYLKAPSNINVFERVSTSLILASTGFPELVKPADDSELFELRIYESHNEDALRRKVKMFNDSEFEIFDEVDLSMVFFGSNIAGNQTPCLTYMLGFKDKEAHEEAWSKFGGHPEWKRILQLEEYADTIIDITRVFLRPLGYSQL